MASQYKAFLVFGAIGIALSLPLSGSGSEADVEHHIMAAGYYAREDTDQDWNIRIVGSVPSLCGIYMLVFNAEGHVIRADEVPHGIYPPESPYVINIKKDGVAGDYKIKIIGDQSDYMALNLPLTELKEVYEVARTTIGHAPDRYLMFQVPDSVKELTVSAYKGHLQVYEDRTGKVVADTRNGAYGGDNRKSTFRFSNYVTFSPTVGTTYRLEPECCYFGFGGSTLYTMFTPDGWFLPDEALQDIKWWRLKCY